MAFENLTTTLKRLWVVPLALALAACDNPVQSDDHPTGLVIVSADDQEVARYAPGSGATGSITIGTTGTTSFRVFALTRTGERITLDGQEYALEVVPGRPGFTATLQGVDRISLAAETPGNYSLVMHLLHEGHREFEATIPVVVSEPGSG